MKIRHFFKGLCPDMDRPVSPTSEGTPLGNYTKNLPLVYGMLSAVLILELHALILLTRG